MRKESIERDTVTISKDNYIIKSNGYCWWVEANLSEEKRMRKESIERDTVSISIDNYIIKSNGYCWWIEENKEIKTGKKAGNTKQVRCTGYCPTINDLADDFVKKRISKHSESIKSVQEALRVIAQAQDDAIRIVKAVIKEGATK